MKATLCAVLLLVGVGWVPASAQPPHSNASPSLPGMSAHGADGSPSSNAFRAADEKMMHDMGAPMTGDADRDFVAGMLPHHQGAVEMAKVELQYGKDPELRRLATGIVQAQEKEIAQMKAWQAKHVVPH
jgi:uncharacterized protein (DUF305 family)